MVTAVGVCVTYKINEIVETASLKSHTSFYQCVQSILAFVVLCRNNPENGCPTTFQKSSFCRVFTNPFRVRGGSLYIHQLLRLLDEKWWSSRAGSSVLRKSIRKTSHPCMVHVFPAQVSGGGQNGELVPSLLDF